MQVDEFKPNWIQSLIQRDNLEDETQILQFGYSEDREFYSYLPETPAPSAWNKFPSKEDPFSRYKFTSLEVNFSPNSLTINRETYSMLDWLGDMGGLLDALYIIGAVLMHPFSKFALKSKLLS